MMPSEQYPRTVVAAAALGAGIAAAALTGCLTRPSVPAGGGNALPPRVLIERALPRGVSDRAGWVADIYGGFTALGIEPSPEQVCAVVAVTEQESGFRVDPEIPGLGAIAWREIDRRADHAGVPRAVVHEVLRLRSPDGQSYGERIDHARTEKELSDIFEDFTGSIPLGRAMFASWNPIHTRGPMQVNVAFAERFAELHRYPYPVRGTIADEVFTRRGSVYFGIAHLLAYQAPYDRYLYRFADYNAGQYASRNAAFQSALSTVSGMVLVADGALLPHDVESGAPERPSRRRARCPAGWASVRVPFTRRWNRGAVRSSRTRRSTRACARSRCAAAGTRWRLPSCRASSSRGRRSSVSSQPSGTRAA